MGIDVVVTDHHEPIPELIPDGIVLNPKVDRNLFGLLRRGRRVQTYTGDCRA